MGCGQTCMTAVNTSSQTVASTGTTLSPGSVVMSYGCGLALNSNGIQVRRTSGLYQIEGSVTFTAGATGTVVISIYVNGVQLPCAISTNAVTTGLIYTIPISAPCVEIESCRMVRPVISIVVSGDAGTVTWSRLTVKGG